MVEITPEVRAQLDEQKKQCVFCKIISKETESNIVFEDSLTIATTDINPWVEGHVLFMPKEHYPIMPYIPPETFKHMFGLIPRLSNSIKTAMVRTGINVFIANGGAAGQQAPHFLMHILPRGSDDSFSKFWFNSDQELPKEELKQTYDMLSKNIPIMLGNHFNRNPAAWHNGNIPEAPHLASIKAESQLIYEDEKSIVVAPNNPLSKGHLIIFSQEEHSLIENLNEASSSHLFYVASFAATAVFEGLGAQGSNIILKSGEATDNEEGILSIHILPRWAEDGIDVLGKAQEPKPDIKAISEKIKDKTSGITQQPKEEPKQKEDNSIDLVQKALGNKPNNEIDDAIKRLKKGN